MKTLPLKGEEFFIFNFSFSISLYFCRRLIFIFTSFSWHFAQRQATDCKQACIGWASCFNFQFSTFNFQFLCISAEGKFSSSLRSAGTLPNDRLPRLGFALLAPFSRFGTLQTKTSPEYRKTPSLLESLTIYGRSLPKEQLTN